MYLVVHVGEGEREEGEQGGGRLVCCNRVKKVFQTHRKEGLETTHVCTSTPSSEHTITGGGGETD